MLRNVQVCCAMLRNINVQCSCVLTRLRNHAQSDAESDAEFAEI